MSTTFTPLASLFGGVLIGTAVVLTLFVLGRLAGVSGITQRTLAGPEAGETAAAWSWRPAFLLGLVAGGALVAWLAPSAVPASPSGLSTAAVLVAGLLVGWGTAQAQGCTSGHGICGLARLAPRSLVATPVFMLAGAATVWVLRHGLGVW
ncbi:YeeE/YedE family protein [Rubrivivax gelatinosus]|uniref:Sulphur transport domain-containing protein n=1 Tax=Rubrivivax gelatinosus TaxID=28068 RepID=A0ABS1DZ31_RUBGE|nr:YeeE/YedE thiosulfate transporter family protein [Rubrivivax gelatinosus]MBK1715004.1 hypothetical protein [Rubrivivax gelatinosus]